MYATTQPQSPILHPEQRYVTDIARERGIDLKLLRHQRETTTCAEKAELLGWPVSRVVKALYFEDRGHTIGVITPEGGRIKTVDLLSSVPALELSRKEASRYRLAREMPYGMILGTGTPFPYESAVEEGGIHELVVVDRPSLEDELVDISVGGKDKRISMHIQYGAIFRILRERFEDRVHKG